MRSPIKTRSSGIWTRSKTASSHPISTSKIKKSSTRARKIRKTTKSKQQLPSQHKDKWQAFFDFACDVSADDDTVRGLLFSALGEGRCFEKGADKESSATNDGSDHAGNVVKSVLSQIYRDLYDVAAAQYERNVAEAELVSGEVHGKDVLLDEVSIGVKGAISESLQTPLR